MTRTPWPLRELPQRPVQDRGPLAAVRARGCVGGDATTAMCMFPVRQSLARTGTHSGPSQLFSRPSWPRGARGGVQLAWVEAGLPAAAGAVLCLVPWVCVGLRQQIRVACKARCASEVTVASAAPCVLQGMACAACWPPVFGRLQTCIQCTLRVVIIFMSCSAYTVAIYILRGTVL